MALIDASRGDTAWLPRHRPKYHRAFELSCKNGTRLNIGLDPVFCDPHGSPRGACIRSFLDPATQNPTTILERGRLRVGQLIVSVNGSPCDSRPFHMILNGIKTALARSRGNLDLGLAFPSDDAMGGRLFTTTPSVVRSVVRVDGREMYQSRNDSLASCAVPVSMRCFLFLFCV